VDRLRQSMHAVNMTFCGRAHDTVLTNRQTEKLNFDTNYTTNLFIDLLNHTIIESSEMPTIFTIVHNLNMAVPPIFS
jgi:hypothetical protein